MSALSPPAKPDLTALRESLRGLEGRRARAVLPFGVEAIDRHLPDGGLLCGAVHEVTGAADGAVDGAAAALFCAGIAARSHGHVLWCLTARDLFAPALAQAGLTPDRVVFAETRDENALLATFEEALKHGALSAVIAETGKLSMLASRRLQLAAETGGTLGLLIRRWKRAALSSEFDLPSAAQTRWRVHSLPSSPLPVEGIGRARWQLDLLRIKGGHPARFEVEACDGQGVLKEISVAQPAALADRPAAQAGHRRPPSASRHAAA
jgi:protein ImuA